MGMYLKSKGLLRCQESGIFWLNDKYQKCHQAGPSKPRAVGSSALLSPSALSWAYRVKCCRGQNNDSPKKGVHVLIPRTCEYVTSPGKGEVRLQMELTELGSMR